MYRGDNLLTPPKAFFNQQSEPVVLDETQANQLAVDWEVYSGFDKCFRGNSGSISMDYPDLKLPNNSI